MKTRLLALLAALAFFSLPAVAFAAPVSWDFTAGILQPLQSGWGALVKADHFQATSTTATSTFADGLNLTGGCFAIGGVCIGAGGGAVSSVFGRAGAVVATAGDYTTAQLTEVTNLFFTNARAIAATLTGFVSGAGTVSSSDTVLSAIQKLDGNIAGKQASGNYITALTGDVAASGPGSSAATLASIITAGSCTNCNLTYDAKGRLTVAANGAAGGGVSSVTATYPALSTGGVNPVISLDYGTTTANVWALQQTFTLSPKFSSMTAGTVNSTVAGRIYNTSTSTPSVTGPITYSGTLGDFTGGVSGAFDCTTASGSVKGCLTAADWTTFNGKGNGTVTSIATNNGITGGTISTTGTIGLATINAGVLGAVTNGSIPTSQATSTLYGTGVGGQVLAWNNGVPQWVATSSIQNITLTTTGSSGAATLTGTTLNVPVYAGGSGTPGGASSTVQYNSNGSFAGNSGLTYTGTNLGVGTSSPFKLLSVAGESYVTGTSTVALGLIVGTSTMGLNVNDFGNAGLGNIVSNWDGRNLLVVGSHGNSAAFSTAGINTFSSRGTSANPTATQANDLIYVMGARGYGTTNYSNGSKAAVIEYAAQNWTDTANGTYITLETTANNSTTRLEALRADQSGNIGIGTTSPYAPLSVSSTTTTGPTAVISGQQPLLQIGSSSPTYGYLANDRLNILDKRNDYSAANIYNLSTGNCATADWTAANDLNATALNFSDFGHTSSGFTGVGCTNNPFTGFGANSTYLFDPSGYINFALGSTSVASFNWFTGGYAAANQVMTLTNAGNLGVGTTTPSQRLSIQGNGLFSGNLSSANLTATGTVTFSALTGTQCLHEISGVVSGTGSDCGGGSGVTGTTGQVAYLSGTNTAVGTSTIFIDTNGRVGIGTTTPYAAFSVNPTGVTGSAARFVVGSSTATNIYVGSNGRVGFGTTITTSPFQFLGTSNTSPNFSVVDFKSTTGDVNATFSSLSGNIAFMGQRDSGSAYFTGPNGFSMDVYGQVTSVVFENNNGTFCAGGIFAPSGGTCANAAIFVKPTTLLTGIGSTTPWGLLSVNPSVTGGAVPMFVVGSSTATNFIIDKTGLVGIGTTSPSSLLQLFSTGTTTLSVDTNSTTKGGCLEVKDSDGVGYTYVTGANGVLTASTISCK